MKRYKVFIAYFKIALLTILDNLWVAKQDLFQNDYYNIYYTRIACNLSNFGLIRNPV